MQVVNIAVAVYHFRCKHVLIAVRPMLGLDIEVTKISLFCDFHNFSDLYEYSLPNNYLFHIWQVSPHLSCDDTIQI